VYKSVLLQKLFADLQCEDSATWLELDQLGPQVYAEGLALEDPSTDTHQVCHRDYILWNCLPVVTR
jgi:hypothetical protein